MECFRQVFRCIKAPFKRERGRVIEIGPPTNFRKEELPACFSDAESVLSPSENPTARLNLTTQSQDSDVAAQPHHGEGRDDDRDGANTIIDEGQGSRPYAQDERKTLADRIRGHMKVARWWRTIPTRGHEHKGPVESVSMAEM
ncbi:uncharacterized protein N7529_002512 [Penicillium soppii]|uniref:uncharacterized protein n=1 Tax=Penicillium soppii TaxID=69789 RepID=UPI0025496B8A|nr:uncharacterized protein N7529_002512 [Penicillium soppii]KAJ5874082.1 hypothetical protein N7529_002512 [Penicillium soppii]